MLIKERNTSYMLWFDVEKRYKTIAGVKVSVRAGCGLM